MITKLRETGASVTTGANSAAINGDSPSFHTAVTTTLRISRTEPLQPVELRTLPYPGFPTDLQAQMMALLTQAAGTSVITETIFENRFMHALELLRMGADIVMKGSTAVIRGHSHLSGAPVMATDLRASMSLILAGLVADNTTQVSRVYHLDRAMRRSTKNSAAQARASNGCLSN